MGPLTSLNFKFYYTEFYMIYISKNVRLYKNTDILNRINRHIMKSLNIVKSLFALINSFFSTIIRDTLVLCDLRKNILEWTIWFYYSLKKNWSQNNPVQQFSVVQSSATIFSSSISSVTQQNIHIC